MFGRNHAVYGAACWMAAYPFAADRAGIGQSESPAVIAMTAIIAAAAAVIPDLDHPDMIAEDVQDGPSAAPAGPGPAAPQDAQSRPESLEPFGVLAKWMGWVTARSPDGHRIGLHSPLFAAAAGAAAWGAQLSVFGRHLAVAACAVAVGLGLAITGPSAGFRVPWPIWSAAGIGVGWWVWLHYPLIAPALWVLASGGVVLHVLCDLVMKTGAPVLMPFSGRRLSLGLMRPGGTGEAVAAVVGVLVIVAAGWRLFG